MSDKSLTIHDSRSEDFYALLAHLTVSHCLVQSHATCHDVEIGVCRYSKMNKNPIY